MNSRLLYHTKSFIKLVLERKVPLSRIFEYWKFFINPYCNKFLISLPRAGWNYVELVLDLAVDIENGGEGNYYYDENTEYWMPDTKIANVFDWNTPAKLDENEINLIKNKGLNCYFNNHSPLSELFSYNIEKLNGVVLIRDMISYLESRFYHLGYKDGDYDKFIQNSDALEFVVRFFNDLNDHIISNDNIVVIKYEELMKSPLQNFKKISNQLNIIVSEESIDKAISLSSKENMQKRFDNKESLNTNRRISVKKRKPFNQKELENITDYLSKNLKNDFGYLNYD